MAGTKEGAAKSRAKILAANPNFYKEIGSIGGAAHDRGGFAYMKEHDPERLKEIGRKAGAKGHRKKKIDA